MTDTTQAQATQAYVCGWIAQAAHEMCQGLTGWTMTLPDFDVEPPWGPLTLDNGNGLTVTVTVTVDE